MIKITKKAAEIKKVIVVTSDKSVILSDNKPKEKSTPTTKEIILGGYTHNQTNASNLWYIKHNLLRFPSVRTVDKLGNDIVGEIEDVDNNSLYVKFNIARSGKAYIN